MRFAPARSALVGRAPRAASAIALRLPIAAVLAALTLSGPSLAAAAAPSDAAMAARIQALVPELEAYIASGMTAFDDPRPRHRHRRRRQARLRQGLRRAQEGRRAGRHPHRLPDRLGDQGLPRHDAGDRRRSRQVPLGRSRRRPRSGVPAEGPVGDARVPHVRPPRAALGAAALCQRHAQRAWPRRGRR